MTAPIRVGINGFGRMGRLALRAAWARPELEFVHINEAKGDAATCAHLLEFDSVHGRWPHAVMAEGDAISIDGTLISTSSETDPAAIPWGEMGIDLVLEATGRFKTLDALQPHFDNGARKVVVAAPVKDPAALNVVMGINDHLYDPSVHDIVTAVNWPIDRRIAYVDWSGQVVAGCRFHAEGNYTESPRREKLEQSYDLVVADARARLSITT